MKYRFLKAVLIFITLILYMVSFSITQVKLLDSELAIVNLTFFLLFASGLIIGQKAESIRSGGNK